MAWNWWRQSLISCSTVVCTIPALKLCWLLRKTHTHTMRPRQSSRHFPDDMFKCIFLNEKIWKTKTKKHLKKIHRHQTVSHNSWSMILTWTAGTSNHQTKWLSVRNYILHKSINVISYTLISVSKMNIRTSIQYKCVVPFFYWIILFVFRLKCHWSLFSTVPSTSNRHWFRYWLYIPWRKTILC